MRDGHLMREHLLDTVAGLDVSAASIPIATASNLGCIGRSVRRIAAVGRLD
jgi:hypothetical protein